MRSPCPPVRRSPSCSINSKANPARATKQTTKTSPALRRRVDALLRTEIDFIPNDSFVGRRAGVDQLSPLAEAVERGEREGVPAPSSGLPAHLGRMCATDLLTPEQERELFQRMNYCKYRANALRSRLSRTKPDAGRVAEIEDCLRRAERLRNHLIQANTRLVMSIARRFADERNAFDDLLSSGLMSLMHAIEKFDYDRGYRFSTYATCAVRRDLCRFVMNRKKQAQRFSTGADELLGSQSEEPSGEEELSESAWRHLSESLQQMIRRLDERERFIVAHRFGLEDEGKRASYSRLGKRLGISKERVRQLANRALEKLQEWAPDYRLEALVN